MINSKKKVGVDDPDWGTFLQDQQRNLEISEQDWKNIFSLRIFRQGEEVKARARIEQVLIGFRMLNSAYNNLNAYHTELQFLLDEVSRVSELAYEYEKYAYRRFLLITRVLEIDPSFSHAILPTEPLEKFYRAGHKVKGAIGDTLDALGKKMTGPKNPDTYWLLRALNQIVMELSDHGPLTRSKKNRRGIGNDVQFVTYLIEIAGRKNGKSIGSGTIIGAIRKLSSEVPTTTQK
jgi:hypothetical protein